MINYINRTKWKKIKKKFERVKETYRLDDLKNSVIVTQYYHRDRLNPESINYNASDSQTICESK